MKTKRLTKREEQRIASTRQRFGAEAFKDFGKRGGRPRKQTKPPALMAGG